jgi:tRNA threonylcarbamoyl adenosine modification protein YeaZ
MEKPLILAFDTSGPYCAAALLSGDAVIAHTVEEMKKGQAERLMFILEELLQLHRLAYAELDALAVGTGPGNFTGIRIGVSAARGLALGLGIPAYGVNGFEQRAILDPSAIVHSITAPRGQRYVHDASGATLISGEAFKSKGYSIASEPTPDAVATSIALAACARFPNPTLAPAPYYIKAPDAAPSKIAAPTILS